ncbi:PAC2 family protein [Modestobacter marinus]|uniref:PAC2 family protein n=1 Tax=Modestobacter marinus TaxID=477641 RepID=UPI001C98BE1C|nr:PAC2 family protein [Modestobacter marinus]
MIDPQPSADELPPLHDPVVVVAFEGWNDAGDAATGAVEHLELIWDATPLAALDPEDYYDFQVNRPTVSLVDGVSRRIEWPTTRVSVAQPPGTERHVVLIRGIEPNMRWRGFCEELIELCQELGAHTVIGLGALLADTPHTRPTPVTGSAYDSDSARQWGLETSRYEGPTGILGVFQDACVQAGLPSLSFWAAVPHYVSQPPSPQATVALLQRVEEVLELTVPLGTLPEQAAEWVKTVSEMAQEDDEVVEYVRSLEERQTASDLSQANGDQIAREFERYLRRRGGTT